MGIASRFSFPFIELCVLDRLAGAHSTIDEDQSMPRQLGERCGILDEVGINHLSKLGISWIREPPLGVQICGLAISTLKMSLLTGSSGMLA